MTLVRIADHVAAIEALLQSLEAPKRSVFYACCAERFFPLYVAFSDAEGWGSAPTLRCLLDSIWNTPTLVRNPRLFAGTLQCLLDETPHAADFESVETTFAQGVSVLISAALRLGHGLQSEHAAIDAAFDSLRVAQCVESTGFLDLGSGQRGREFEVEFLGGPLFKRERKFQTEDLDVLSNCNRSCEGLAIEVRARARANRYSVSELLPTQRHSLATEEV
jgi:uncharacterized protein YjaG (DUF416 family)